MRIHASGRTEATLSIRKLQGRQPRERVQLRDDKDNFLDAKEERSQLETYSKDLFWPRA